VNHHGGLCWTPALSRDAERLRSGLYFDEFVGLPPSVLEPFINFALLISISIRRHPNASTYGIATALVFLAPAAFAQATGTVAGDTAQPQAESPATVGAVAPGTLPVGNPPELGGPLLPATDSGLDKVASDGVSTRTVRAVPCSRAARETDGSTTCVGIPGRIRTGADGTTTGMAR
jgi:hypothetical protein